MAQPVLNVEETKSKGSVAINLLPCKVHHDGPVGSIQAHWQADKAKDVVSTAYFRGRKLHGTSVAIPADYKGVLVQKQEGTTRSEAEKSEGDETVCLDDAQEGTLQIMGEFQDIIVWGHESVADPSSDYHVRGMAEWMEVSEKIHFLESGTNGEKQS